MQKSLANGNAVDNAGIDVSSAENTPAFGRRSLDEVQMKAVSNSLENLVDGLLLLPSRDRKSGCDSNRQVHRALRLLRLALSLTHLRSSWTSSRRSLAETNGFHSSTVRCGYSSCPTMLPRTSDGRGDKTATVDFEWQRSWKTCHYCPTAYCSSACREADWEWHKSSSCSTEGRLANLCKRVLRRVRDNRKLQRHLANIAVNGHRSFGAVDGGRRGCVLAAFADVADAECFVSRPSFDVDGDAIGCYVGLEQLTLACGGQIPPDLESMCVDCDPRTRFVVCVVVVDEDARSSCVRGALFPVPCRVTIDVSAVSDVSSARISPSTPATRSPGIVSGCSSRSEVPETLILTAVPGCQRTPASTESAAPAAATTAAAADAESKTTRRGREIAFANVQRRLRQRGVSLRRQHPDVYEALCRYVTDGRSFAPVSIFPIDVATGRRFMCVIMPDAEPEISWLDGDENDHNNNDGKDVQLSRFKPEAVRTSGASLSTIV